MMDLRRVIFVGRMDGDTRCYLSCSRWLECGSVDKLFAFPEWDTTRGSADQSRQGCAPKIGVISRHNHHLQRLKQKEELSSHEHVFIDKRWLPAASMKALKDSGLGLSQGKGIPPSQLSQ